MNTAFSKYATVLLSSGLQKGLDYGIPDEYQGVVQKGSLVQVTLRGRLINAVVLSLKTNSAFSRVLPIKKVLYPESLIGPKQLEFAIWISNYYQTELSRVLKFFLPTEVRKDLGHKEQRVVSKKKSLEEIRQFCTLMRGKRPKQVHVLDAMLKVEKEIFLSELLEETKASRGVVDALVKEGLLQSSLAVVERDPLKHAEFFRSKAKVLNEQQKQVLSLLKQDIDRRLFKVNLLHGVTGSGKTEVYLQAIDYALKQGKNALLLVPEVALTTQTIEKFKGHFDCRIAVLHHRLSKGERFDQWHSIRKGDARIVIGARSAIFAPIENLGLIVIDEEHEGSYKQTDEMPTYHARDLAVMRGKIEQACVLLGSATPSFESYYNAEKGKYRLLKLSSRATAQQVPKISLVDMKFEHEKAQGYTNFSDPLIKALKNRYEKGEQSILFLNRRGYHTSLVCSGCGAVVSCPHCELALTFYMKTQQMSCHLCEYTCNAPKVCLQCKEQTIQYKGVGTEKIEAQLKKMFPHIRTLRMDGETTRHKGSYEKLYYAFRNQKADILIGTQMIAKGLHFPNVTFVGVLNGDSQLNVPDFKASEMVFQLMTQVAGRAGRGFSPGEVLIQTYNPQNPILNLALEQNFEKFYEKESTYRKLFQFPPYIQLIKVVFKGPDEEKTETFSQQFQKKIGDLSLNHVQVGSALPCGYPKIKEQYRFQVLIKTLSIKTLENHLKKALYDLNKPKNIHVLIDVNPVSTYF